MNMKMGTKKSGICKHGFLMIAIGIIMLLPSSVFAVNQYIKLCLAGMAFEKNGDYDKAIAKYGEAIALKPTEWSGYYYRANVYTHQYKYTEAIADASQGIVLSPRKSRLYILRGDCYMETVNYEKAIADYNNALTNITTKDKQVYLIHFNRGRALYNTKQYNDAIIDFSKSIELAKAQKYSRYTDYYNWRARSYCEINKYGEAIADFKAYLAENPNDITALYFQGNAYLKAGDATNARAVALTLSDRNPSEANYFKGEHLLDMFNLEKRQATVKSLVDEVTTSLGELSQIPSKSMVNIRLNDAFHKIDSAWILSSRYTAVDRALNDTIYNQLFSVYPRLKDKPDISETARKYMVQATKATEEKKYNEAISLWSKALSIAPYYPLAYYNRALLQELSNNYSGAISDMKKYIKLSPNASDLRSAQDKIYEWEAKGKNAPQYTNAQGQINTVVTNNYNPGSFVFSLAFGGSMGAQITKNPTLETFWTENAPANTDYTNTPHLITSGDIEAVIKPIKWIGIGMFAKTTGGLGSSAVVSSTHYKLNLKCNQIGGLVRLYFQVNNLANKLDIYAQYSFGTNTLNGYYGISGSNSLYTDMTSLKSTAPYYSLGLGMGGKIGKHGYIVFSGDYLESKFENITYKRTLSSTPGLLNTGGRLVAKSGSMINANLNGLVFKMLFGFCF